MCANEDREQYGETYWHRIHQLDHVDICPIHGCHLQNSIVDITSRPSPSLIHAEEVVPLQFDKIVFGSNLALNTAKYTAQVFLAEMDMDNDVSVGQFLHSRMEYTKYLTARGVKRLIAPLYEDFSSFYRELPNLTITEPWQLEKIFTSHQKHCYDICLLAMFLDIPASELTHMSLPEKTQAMLFDEQIIHLHDLGLNYRQISQRMDSSYDYCKLVAKRHHLRTNVI
jgi:hypothetical protein